MPKSYPISSKEIEWLKSALENKFGLKIEDTHACISLSDLIFKSHKISINYNTFRRLFEIVPNKNAPSLYTLNEISKALDFPDFETLKEVKNKLDKDFIHETLHLFRISKHINPGLLQEIIRSLSMETWESVYQLSTLVELLIQYKQLEYLADFLRREIDENDWDSLFKYYIAFQQIHLAAKLKNRYVIDFVKSQINQSKIIQLILLQLYVEEDDLPGYFGEWVFACHIYLTSDMHLFLNCMKIQYYFQKNDLEKSINYLAELNTQVGQTSFSIHPILLGRISAWNYILKNDLAFFNIQVTSNISNLDKLSIITFFYRLLLTYCDIKKFVFVDYITKFPLNSIDFHTLDFNKKAEVEIFYLLLSRYQLEAGNSKDAADHFQKISGKFNFSCTMLFFKKEYHFLKSKFV